MPAITPEQVTEVVETGANLLREAADLTSGRDPNYIRDAQPANVIDTLALAAARQGCRRYQQKGGDYGSRRAARAERACRPYLDSLEPGKGPTLALPFRGGQCPGVPYIFRYQAREQVNGSWQWSTTRQRFLNGPISIRKLPGNGPQGCAQFNLVPAGFGLYSGTSQLVDTLINQCVDLAPGYRVISIAVNGPQTDNCGNPPIEFEPPKAPTTPLPPGPQPFTRSPDIDVDIDVSINPDFSININVGTGPITIDPFADPVLTDPGGGGGDPGDPTDPGSPGTPIPTGAGGEAAGNAPAGQELVGLLVTVAQAPGDANKFSNNPKQPFRGIGYVRMGYPGRLGLDISGGTVISPQFFHAQQRGLTSWNVAANTGFNLTVQPYFRGIET